MRCDASAWSKSLSHRKLSFTERSHHSTTTSWYLNLCQSKKRKRQKKFCVNQTKLLMMLSFLVFFCGARCDALVLLSLFLVMEIDPNFAWKAPTKDASMLHNFQQETAITPQKSPVSSFATIAIYIHKAFASILAPQNYVALERQLRIAA